MVDKKVTKMVVKVDLNCEKCRKKIKKVLCDIPEIQNQLYDEKANTVTITVVCCNPEKIKKKILCKGCKIVTCVEIVPPPKPPPPPPPPTPPPTPPPPPPPKPECHSCCKECCGGCGGGPCYDGCGKPVCHCWCGGGYWRACYVRRCDYYLIEENPAGCIIM